MDNIIRERLYEVLAADPRVDARGIIVDVHNGVVVLSGEVPSYTSIHVAETIARRTTGAEVKNYLRSGVNPQFAYR